MDQYKQVDRFIVTSHLLGKGSFGFVYRGFFKEDHSKIVAVKTIGLAKISSDPKFLELLKREIDIMQNIVHPNIVRMYGASRTTNNLYMFLEYCRDGDIKTLLKKNKEKLPESEALLYLRQIVNSIIHRDIKPANILLHEGIAKITDFGFARVVENSMEAQGKYSKVGTPLYMSPQILAENGTFSRIMFYEMLYGKTPWTANSPYQLLENIKSNKLEFDKKPVRSETVKKMLRSMLIYEDKERISWQEMFENELIKEDPNKIKENIDKIDEEKDPLTKSVAMNSLYVSKNKVMNINNKNSTTAQIFFKDKAGKNVGKKENKKKIVYQDDFETVLKHQDKEEMGY